MVIFLSAKGVWISLKNKDTDIIINDYIKIGMKYDDVVDEYGEEDGKFYQDKSFLVWSLGEKNKIGEPYYLLKFNSSKKVEEIRIGIWWFEEEFEHIVEQLGEMYEKESINI